jgi:hypothetical protein
MEETMSKHANVMPFKPGNNGQQMYDPAQAVPKLCPCGCDRFAMIFKIAMVSRLAPGNKTGQDLFISMPVYACVNCGKLLSAVEAKPETGEQEGKDKSDEGNNG